MNPPAHNNHQQANAVGDTAPNAPPGAARIATHGANPSTFENVFIRGTGAFLPGPAIGNDTIDRFIAPLDKRSTRIRNKVLRENGIDTRHYAIDEEGRTKFSLSELAGQALQTAMADAGLDTQALDLLCTGSSGGDTGMPGFANMVQGHLRLPPLEASSHHGVCAAGIQALKYAASALELNSHRHAAVVAAEMPSRLFKHSRFVPSGHAADFDAQFLRWMLSDGAGALTLARTPAKNRLSLRLRWLHTRAFSGDYPVCMQIGYAEPTQEKSYLDYPSLADAERAGAFMLRQDIRLLPNLFEVAIHEYASLASQGWFDPTDIDHFLCHYSSQKFSVVVERLMTDAGLTIPVSRWYSNLSSRGNTGAASIFIMLDDFVRKHDLRHGQKILCFVPESGRFTIACMLLEVFDPRQNKQAAQTTRERPAASKTTPTSSVPDASSDGEDPTHIVPPPHRAPLTGVHANVLRELTNVWHSYRSRAWRTMLVSRILDGSFSRADYLSWMACWIPQVREGSQWMRRAKNNLAPPYDALAPLVQAAADDEQLDYTILFQDYQRAGGQASSVDALKRNPGGEALNAYMYAVANTTNPVGLLGATYIIEGTGQRIIPHLMPRLRTCDNVPHDALRFLHYHAENDISHLERWLDALKITLSVGSTEQRAQAARSIVDTATETAELYLMQMRASVG